MKWLLCLVLLSFAVKNPVYSPTGFIPEEFRSPDNKIGAGKTFVYQNTSTNQMIFRDLRSLNINGQHFQTVTSYDSASVSDSVKLLNGKAVEMYNFFMNKGGNPIRAESIQDTVLNSGPRPGIHLSQDRYQTNDLIYIESSKEQFLKDTVLAWEGTQLPCLVIFGNSNVEIKVRADTSLHQNIEVVSLSYYAKGIGNIQYSTQFTDHIGKNNYNFWKLKSIRDIKN